MKKCTLTFLTPCFCAGADQNTPEIRPASIRGELRKWLRICGATLADETEIMGGIVNKDAKKSKVTIRVANEFKKAAHARDLPSSTGISNSAYLLHFANPMPKDHEQNRTADKRFIAPESSFDLIVIDKLKNDIHKVLLYKAIDAMILLGSLGLRSTRTCGAWYSEENANLTFEEIQSKLYDLDLPLEIGFLEKDNTTLIVQDWKKSIDALGATLRCYRASKVTGTKKLTAGKQGDNQTPLGTATPRQKSGLHLRPIQCKDGIISLLYYTDMFLDVKSKLVPFDILNDLDEDSDSKNKSLYSITPI